MASSKLKSTANQLKTLILENKALVIATLCTTVFVLLLEDVLSNEAMKLDEAAYWLIVQHLRQDWLTPIMESFSNLATPISLAVLWVLIAAFAPGKRPGWCAAVNLALILALNQVLKFIVRRPRPDGFRLAEASGFSFPSGHSMVAMAFFGLLVWFVWRYEKDSVKRTLLTIALCAVIAMIGISRVYLGVHYASDVLGGFCLSVIWLVFFTKVIAPIFMGSGERSQITA